MQEMASDTIPKRWRDSTGIFDGEFIAEPSGSTLQEWLEEMYFDGERKEDLTKEDIVKLGQIIRRLLRFEPSSRASVKDILDDPWFGQ